jgi:hypothetical protein
VARAQTSGRSGAVAAVCGLAACVATFIPPAWEAQAQRGVSQQIRITARVRPFCRMANTPHQGLRIEGHTLGGEYVQHRFGDGRFNIICNTPYALHLQRWHSAEAGPPWDPHGLSPRYARVENTQDLDVWLQFAGRTAAVERRCVLAALGDATSVCPGPAHTESTEEAVFPPSRTVAWLAVEARPPRVAERKVSETARNADPGITQVAARGTAGAAEWLEDYLEPPESRGEYVALSVTARY